MQERGADTFSQAKASPDAQQRSQAHRAGSLDIPLSHIPWEKATGLQPRYCSPVSTKAALWNAAHRLTGGCSSPHAPPGDVPQPHPALPARRPHLGIL